MNKDTKFQEWFDNCTNKLYQPEDFDKALMYACLGLAGETGEVLEPIKKSVRTNNPTDLDKDELTKELGDVLFYLASIANLLEISLDDIIELNTQKRKKRGLLK